MDIGVSGEPILLGPGSPRCFRTQRALRREHERMTHLVLVRHAEPLVAADVPGERWLLTDKGKEDARSLGARIAERFSPRSIWTSPETRAHETARLVCPAVPLFVREELSEVKKPWYPSADEHAKAVSRFFRGESVDGWESRADAVARLSKLKGEAGSSEQVILVTHGVILTSWLVHEIGLDDPFSFWSNLRVPDAWELDVEGGSLQRVT
jgi:broad specificity phosphatase PhoE